MGDTMPTGTPPRNDHRQSVVTDSLRKRLGLFTSAAAHRRELQSPRDVEALLESCVAHGQLVRAEALLERFDRIVHPAVVELPSDELILAADQADKDEDVLETRAHLTRCPVERKRWARAHRVAEALNRRLGRALEALIQKQEAYAKSPAGRHAEDVRHVEAAARAQAKRTPQSESVIRLWR